MQFIPLNRHVEVKPVEQKSIVATANEVYEEKGAVLSIADGVTAVKVGEICYFDSWLCAKYPDSEGNIRYLVPEENIRAVERAEWKPVWTTTETNGK